MTELFVKQDTQEKDSQNFYSNYIDELHDDGTFTRHFPSNQTSNIIKPYETVIMKLIL